MTKQAKRPALVTWLALVVFSLAVANLGSVYAGLARRWVFAALDLDLPVWLLMIHGGLWGMIWLVVAWALWRLLSWSRYLTIVLFVMYALTTIGQQVVFTRGAYERGRLPFVFITAALFISLVAIVLTRPRIRRAFEGSARVSEHCPDKEPTSS